MRNKMRLSVYCMSTLEWITRQTIFLCVLNSAYLSWNVFLFVSVRCWKCFFLLLLHLLHLLCLFVLLSTCCYLKVSFFVLYQITHDPIQWHFINFAHSMHRTNELKIMKMSQLISLRLFMGRPPFFSELDDACW